MLAVDHSIVRGDSWKYRVMLKEKDGRFITDGQINSGELSKIYSATAAFTIDDIGKQVVTKTGDVVADGTTIVAVDEVAGAWCSISPSASDPIAQLEVLIRAADMSGYTARCQGRNRADDTSLSLNITVDSARDSAGVYYLELLSTDTVGKSGKMVYDFEVSDGTPEGVTTLCGGTIEVTKDVTR